MDKILVVFFVTIIVLLIFFYYHDTVASQLTEDQKSLKTIISKLPKENKMQIPILYINLDRSKERNQHMLNQIKEYKLSAKRISGIDGSNLKNNPNIKYTNTFNLSEGELGCTLSHLKAVKYAYENDYDRVVIIEDDLSFDLMPLWPADLTIPSLIEKESWDIMQLTNCNVKCPMKKTITQFDPDCWGCGAYVIKRSGMKNLLDKYYKDGQWKLEHTNDDNILTDGRADILMYKYAGVAKMNNYPLFYTINTDSTIHMNHDVNAILYRKKVLDFYGISNYNIFKNILNFNHLTYLDNCSLSNKRYVGYRLGDMVTLKEQQVLEDGKEYHLKNFPDSIASEYMRTTNEYNRFDILSKIVKKRMTTFPITNDDVVIHLRVGDVINDNSGSIEDILLHPTKNDKFIYKDYYTPTLNYIYNKIASFDSIHNVIIVAGNHLNVNQAKSCKYIFAIKELLEIKNYSVTTRLGNDPDDDFVLMCTCENLISSRGNFAYVINQVRKEFGLSYTDTKKLSFH